MDFSEPGWDPRRQLGFHEIEHSCRYRESFALTLRGQRPAFGGTSLSLVRYPRHTMMMTAINALPPARPLLTPPGQDEFRQFVPAGTSRNVTIAG